MNGSRPLTAVLLSVCSLCFFSDEPIRPGQVLVRALSPEEFEVRAGYAVGGATERSDSLTHLTFASTSEELSQLEVIPLTGKMQAEILSPGGLKGLSVSAREGEGGHFELRYKVHSQSGRIPLFVPVSDSRAADGELEIELQLEPDLWLRGDSFPRFSRQAGSLKAVLFHFPSFLLVDLRSGPTTAGTLLTVGLLTNLSLFVISFGIMVFWLRLRQRAVDETAD